MPVTSSGRVGFRPRPRVVKFEAKVEDGWAATCKIDQNEAHTHVHVPKMIRTRLQSLLYDYSTSVQPAHLYST